MNTKIRTAIITLIASASFGVATVAPTVSQAQDNSAEHVATCEIERLTFELQIESMKMARARGQKDLAAYYAQQAQKTAESAIEQKCAWTAAAKETGDQPIVAPVGPVKQTETPPTVVVKTGPVPSGPVKEAPTTVFPAEGGHGPEVPVPTQTKVVGKTPVVSSKTAS